jgi:hypothetical protein
MARLWNLLEFDELEEHVLLPYAELSSARRRQARIPGKPSRYKVALGIAALAANFSISLIQASTSTVRIAPSSVPVIQSIAEERAPLDELFSQHFGTDWTREREEAHLLRLEARRAGGSPERLAEWTIDTVFANQLEDLRSQTGRLTREQVSKLVRGKKSR